MRAEIAKVEYWDGIKKTRRDEELARLGSQLSDIDLSDLL